MVFHITITLIRGQSFFLKDTPHLPGCNRNIDMPYPNMGQRIDNRIGDCLRSADSGRFTYTFGPDRMMRRWWDGLIGLPMQRLHLGWYQVVLEIAAQYVAIL